MKQMRNTKGDKTGAGLTQSQVTLQRRSERLQREEAGKGRGLPRQQQG